jgi:hypothetical protein
MLAFMSRKIVKHKYKWMDLENWVSALRYEYPLLAAVLFLPAIFDVVNIPAARSALFLCFALAYLVYHGFFSHAVTSIYLRPLGRVIAFYRPPQRFMFDSDEEFHRAVRDSSSAAAKTAKMRLLSTKFFTKLGMPALVCFFFVVPLGMCCALVTFPPAST